MHLYLVTPTGHPPLDVRAASPDQAVHVALRYYGRFAEAEVVDADTLAHLGTYTTTYQLVEDAEAEGEAV